MRSCAQAGPARQTKPSHATTIRFRNGCAMVFSLPPALLVTGARSYAIARVRSASRSTTTVPITATKPAAAGVVDVLVPVALDHAYSYRVPAALALAPGDFVAVPLGPRETMGVVWGDGTARLGLDNRLKDVSEKLDIPPLKDELRRFVEWVADYTLSPRGMVLRMCLRMGEHLGPERLHVGVRVAGPPPERLTAARRRVLAVLADGLMHGKAEAAELAGVSVGVIDGLVDEGTLETFA